MQRCRTLVLSLVPLFALGAGELRAQASKVPDTLEQRVLACAICHGKQGEGIQKNEYYPRLAGKPAGYLYNQLVNFRERRRDVPIMTYMVAFLSDPYLREMAEYYANLRPPFPAPAAGAPKALLARGEALVTKGDPSRDIPACAACHGNALTGMEPAIPAIVGLHRDYVAGQMGSWKVGRRKSEPPDCMAQVASRLTPDDIAAVNAWLGTQRVAPDARPAPAGSLKLPLECGGVQ
jgi:cytochrome c553